MRVGHFQAIDVFRRFDQHDRLRRLAHRTDHFIVPLVSDQDDRAALRGVLDRLQVDFGHQGTGGVDGSQLPLGRLPPDLGGHAVRGKQQRGAKGHFGHIVDEHSPPTAKSLDHVLVVDNFVIDIDRRAKGLDRQIEALDRHVHPRTKSAGSGQ